MSFGNNIDRLSSICVKITAKKEKQNYDILHTVSLAWKQNNGLVFWLFISSSWKYFLWENSFLISHDVESDFKRYTQICFMKAHTVNTLRTWKTIPSVLFVMKQTFKIFKMNTKTKHSQRNESQFIFPKNMHLCLQATWAKYTSLGYCIVNTLL